MKNKSMKKLATLLAMSLLLGPLTGVRSSLASEIESEDPANNDDELVTSGDTVEPGDAAGDSGVTVIDPTLVYSEELLQYIPEVEDYISYLEYQDVHANIPEAEQSIELDIMQVGEGETDEAFEGPSYDLLNGELHTYSGGHIEIPFDVAETAMYELEIEYMPLEGTGTVIERRFAIDGEVPYEEAALVILRRTYQDENRDYKDIELNQYFPSQVEAPRWTTTRISDEGVRVLMSGLNTERLVLTGGPLGLMQAALDIALPYVRERRQFDAPIGSFGIMQAKIADMYTALQSSRAFAYQVARDFDAGHSSRVDAASCLLHASEAAVQVALEAIQSLGGNGYINEYPTGRILRDAKLYAIGAGTNEIRRMLIGRELFEDR